MRIQDYKNIFIKSIKDTVHYVNVHKFKAISSLAIISMLSTTAYAGESYYKSNLVDVYHVYLHGEEIGVVNSPKVVEEWIANKQQEEAEQFNGYDLQIDSDVTYEHQSVYKGTYDNENTINVLATSVEVKAKAFKLVVNGEFIGYVKDKATADAILNSIKKKYTHPYEKKNTISIASLTDENDETPVNEEENDANNLLSVSFKEDVELLPTIIEPAEMNDADTITEILTDGVEEQQTYKIVAGDYLGKIAGKVDLPTAELLRLNPGLTEKSVLQIGQELNVTAMSSKLTVQTVVEQKVIESIPFKTEYVEDNTMYKNEEKVKQQGVKGEKEVTYQVTSENGLEVDRTAVGEVILSQPVTKIVRKGTKPVPVVSTGQFIWPTKGGVVTSNYGYRWGAMHTGIDISGVKDKTIMAADNGTVTFAGWKKSYGNIVIIDHGGGIETYYAHLSSISVEKGQKVAQGQKVGVMGSTGNSTGTHLHFEIRKNGKATNPSNAFK